MNNNKKKPSFKNPVKNEESKKKNRHLKPCSLFTTSIIFFFLYFDNIFSTFGLFFCFSLHFFFFAFFQNYNKERKKTQWRVFISYTYCRITATTTTTLINEKQKKNIKYKIDKKIYKTCAKRMATTIKITTTLHRKKNPHSFYRTKKLNTNPYIHIDINTYMCFQQKVDLKYNNKSLNSSEYNTLSSESFRLAKV